MQDPLSHCRPFPYRVAKEKGVNTEDVAIGDVESEFEETGGEPGSRDREVESGELLGFVVLELGEVEGDPPNRAPTSLPAPLENPPM